MAPATAGRPFPFKEIRRMEHRYYNACSAGIALLILFVFCALPGCSREDGGEISFLVRKDRLPRKDSGGQITDFSQLAGKKVGVITGSSYDVLQREQLPFAIPEYFNNFTDQLEALKSGKIAGIILDEPIARDIMTKNTAVTCIKEVLRSDGYAFAFSKTRADLHQQVNAALMEMQDAGTLKKLDDKWFAKDDSGKVLPDLKLDGKNGTIRFATDSESPPFSYIKDGRIVGYDIEIAMTIAEKLGLKPEIINMDFGAIIPSLVSGKTDMAGACITVTKERAQSVLFSLPNYSGGVLVMVASGSGGQDKTGGFWSGLAESFKRTFLIENRYRLVLQGLWITIVISIFSGILGTILGFGVCMMRRAKTRWANIPAKVFIRTIQGTPMVVLLMILYYIIFGNVDISGVAVAIIGFAVSFAAYVSEMMRAGIDAVDKRQHEAAEAIGFNKVQVFTRITFPQAVRHVLPVYKGELITMLKMTSIVGYIAVQDLTKMSDIIRSRTYEAFFPLIATALIYFFVAWSLAYLLSLVEMRVDPKQRKRIVKGVVVP
jgi:polar amino acid transport system substrate-binding protein